MDERIKRSFEKALGLNQGESDRLTDNSSVHTVSNWDSLGHLRLITALEEKFNVKITSLEAIELINISEIKKMLTNKKISLSG